MFGRRKFTRLDSDEEDEISQPRGSFVEGEESDRLESPHKSPKKKMMKTKRVKQKFITSFVSIRFLKSALF